MTSITSQKQAIGQQYNMDARSDTMSDSIFARSDSTSDARSAYTSTMLSSAASEEHIMMQIDSDAPRGSKMPYREDHAQTV